MDFKVKIIPISTGTLPIVVLNREECAEMDIHLNERVKIINPKNKKEIIAAVDFQEDGLAKGTISVMQEVSAYLRINNKSHIQLVREDNPISVKYIKEKLENNKLSKEKIETIISDVVKGRLTDIDLTYFVSGCYVNGLNTDEIINLTKAIVNSGEQLNLKDKNDEKIFDKHCVGGVAGNRTTMLVIPIIAAYGVKIPKTSSRAITSPSGTADTMEVFCNVCLDAKKLEEVVRKTNGCIVWGGALNLAPADDKIIRVEHPLSIDTDGLMLASILAKKFSVGSNTILIDIPVAEDAKVKTLKRANALKKLFTKIGNALGMKIKIVITDGSEPIGNGVGPLMEAIDVLKVLKNDPTQPMDLRKKTIYMASELLDMHIHDMKKTRKIVEELLNSGKAYHKFMEIVHAQGKKKLPDLAKFKLTFSSERTGKIKFIDNKEITRLARFCGAPKTKQAGLYVHKKVGDFINRGDALITFYANNEDALNYAKDHYIKSKVFEIKDK